MPAVHLQIEAIAGAKVDAPAAHESGIRIRGLVSPPSISRATRTGISVFVNRRWVAVDAAFDQTDVDAAHIKLADTSLDGVSPYESFMPVARVSNKLTFEPVEIR